MTKEEILAKAIQDYPIGAKIKSCQSGDEFIISSQDTIWISADQLQFRGKDLGGGNSTPFVHYSGKWSEVLELPKGHNKGEVNNTYTIF